ncbi:MAG: LapA family protein, partial [Actinomycetes bacterium]
MKRALLIIIGIILLVVGLAATIGGAAVLIFVGPGGVYSADAGRITGTGNALLFNEFKVNTGNYTSTVEKFVELTVGASGANGQQVFIGVGPSAAVNHYLAGVQRDVVSDINGSSAKVTSIPGTTKPTPPNNQTFWTDKAVGNTATIKVDPKPGTTLVIMNANTTAPVSVNLLIGGKSSSLFPGAIVSVVIGVLLIVLAVWLFIVAKRSKRKAQIQAEAYTPPTLQPP